MDQMAGGETGVAMLGDSTTSEALLERACRSLAGGDSSTMRVLPYHVPLFAERGEGPRIWDADGNEYVDLNMAYGPLLLGHCPPRVSRAVCRQVTRYGSQFGFPNELTTRVAEKIKILFPSMELMRFANSGTEAIASAIRLARTVTGRNRIIVFEGNYHGWSDSVFHKYHAPLDQLPAEGFGPALPGTTGINATADEAIVVRSHDCDALHRALDRHRGSIAGVILEPVMGNAGVVPPPPGFLAGVREATRDHDCLLIFDEVITGLRVAGGGAQERYQVFPDITVLSKALGGGYPVAAFGASREIMDVIVNGLLFHGGVYSGNAVVMAAAEAVLDAILEDRESFYSHLYDVGNMLCDGLREIVDRLGVPAVAQNVGPMISLFLTHDEVDGIADYRDVRRHCDFEKFIEFQHHAQRLGVYFHPNLFEPMYLSTAHTRDDIASALDRIEDAARCTLLN